MSAPTGMSCESCRPLLLQLVCEELTDDAAREVRAHAERCERCGAALAKLNTTMGAAQRLPLLSPSPELERRIMQAARDAMASKAKGPAREAASPAGGVRAWLDKLAAWAMSPQVAMASVLVLVVGIGLYALPLGQHAEHAALHEDDGTPSLPSPATSAAVTPTPAVPAERVEEAAANEAKDFGHRALEAEAPGSAVVNRAKQPRASAAPEKKAADGLAELRGAESGGGSGALEMRKGAAEKSRAAAKPSKAAPASQSAPQADTMLGESEAAEQSAADRAPPSAAASSPAPEPATPVRAGSGPSDDKAKEAASEEGLASGITAVQRGEHARGRGLLLAAAKSSDARERTDAALWLARSYKQQNECARAIPYYRVVTGPASAARQVLEEAATCYEQVGDSHKAAELRARAGVPAAK